MFYKLLTGIWVFGYILFVYGIRVLAVGLSLPVYCHLISSFNSVGYLTKCYQLWNIWMCLMWLSVLPGTGMHFPNSWFIQFDQLDWSFGILYKFLTSACETFGSPLGRSDGSSHLLKKEKRKKLICAVRLITASATSRWMLHSNRRTPGRECIVLECSAEKGKPNKQAYHCAVLAKIWWMSVTS
jgi:hypothetical protein